LAKAESDGFDLYLLDNWISGDSGIELCRQLRSLRPGIPIVFYSGVDQESDKAAAMRAGAQAYLVKPTGIDTIRGVISWLLGDGDGAGAADSSVRMGADYIEPGVLKRVVWGATEQSRIRIERSSKRVTETRELITRTNSKLGLPPSKQD
jgi:DNA-binding response OmpR family regulator